MSQAPMHPGTGRETSAAGEPLLEIRGLEAGYGDSQVLFGLDLALEAGQVATLMGRNGMGKSSTVRCLFGLLPARGGEIRFQGERIDGLSPDRIARRGLALVPEGRQVFPNLTVEENLLAFATRRDTAGPAWTLEAVYDLFPQLPGRRHHAGGQLSGGEQQMVAIARALMTNPHLLVLDEATEGLAPRVRETIWECLARLRERGQSILVIDKYVRRLLPLADRHTLIERGRAAWQGDSSALAADPSLWERYIGV